MASAMIRSIKSTQPRTISAIGTRPGVRGAPDWNDIVLDIMIMVVIVVVMLTVALSRSKPIDRFGQTLEIPKQSGDIPSQPS